MTRNYASLCDVKYLAKLLAMYESLSRHSSEPFILHVLAMDEDTLRILHEMNLPNMRVMSLPTFERTMNLGGLKDKRTWQEFCWTAASQLMECLLPWINDGVTYLDADLYFFADPKVMFDELGERSIAIVPHRLIPSKRHLSVNGKFNVGWVTIQNTEIGRRCLARWAAQCRNRCSAEVGCGDQLYLDEWPELYGSECCVIENIGANVAPWNLANYGLYKFEDGLMLAPPCEHVFAGFVPVCFYHFHEFTNESILTNYQLRPEDVALIYAPYIEEWKADCGRVERAERSIKARQHSMELQSERA
jgi:hypothetical protein